MAKQSFEDLDKSAEDNKPAVVERDLPATPTQIGVGAGVEGELGMEDVRVPRINVVQKVGDLSEVFDFGDVVLDKELKLASMGDPISVTVLHMKNQYKESIPYGSDIMPNVFDTKQEVLENGGNFTYGQDGYYERVAHATLLIEAPEGEEDNPLFSFTFDGKSYAMVLFTMQRTSFTSMGKEINTAAAHWAKDGIWKIKWEMSTEKRKAGANTFCVPKLRRSGRHSDEFVAFAEGLMMG